MHGAGSSKDHRSTRFTMSNGQHRQSRSASEKSTAPSSSTTRSGPVQVTNRPSTTLQPAARALPIHHIPEDWILTQNSIVSNKLVLSFETELSFQEVHDWIKDFNQSRKTRLTLHDELPNALFVVHFDAVDLLATKQRFLAASPLGAAECYASVNEFALGLDPCSIPSFKHLVTVNIRPGNSETFSFINYIADTLGTFIKARLDDDPHLISLVVETTRKVFPVQGCFQLPRPGLIILDFEYTGRNQRCCFCFSYRHRPALCSRPRPALFASFDQDTVNSFGGISGTSCKDYHQPGLPPVTGPLPSGSTGGARTLQGHNMSGASQGRHEGEANSGESSTQRKRRNRPRHRSNHYQNPFLTSSNPNHSASCAGPSVALDQNSRQSGEASLSPGAVRVVADSQKTPIRPCAPAREQPCTPSVAGTSREASGTGARRQIWVAKPRQPATELTKANPLTPPNNIAIGDPSHHTPPTKINGSSTVRLSQAQQKLRNAGLSTMGDIMHPGGQFIPWEQWLVRGISPTCRNVYQALTGSLKVIPELNPSLDGCELFIEDPDKHLAGLFLVPPAQRTARWLPFMDFSSPHKTFRTSVDILYPSAPCTPSPTATIRRIMVQAPRGGTHLTHCGEWDSTNTLLSQYQWNSGLSLLKSSTASLRRMQNTSTASSHISLRKWALQLGTRIPDTIWLDTWSTFRSAKENTFL